jgi:hypothetical protein
MACNAMFDPPRWSLALWAFVCLLLCADVVGAQAPDDPQVGGAIARTGTGWVYLGGKKLWTVDAQGAATVVEVRSADGVEMQWPRKVAGSTRGFALWHDTNLTWFGANTKDTLAGIENVVMAPSGETVVAAGTIASESGDGEQLAVIELGADGRWIVHRTQFTQVETRGLDRRDGHWHLMITRWLEADQLEAEYGIKRGSEGEEQPGQSMLELWTSSDAVAWQRCELPEKARLLTHVGEASFASYRGTLVASIGGLVLQAVAPRTFVGIDREGLAAPQRDETLWVDGDTLHATERGRWRSTRNLRTWSVRTGSERIPMPTIAALHDGKLMSIVLDKQSSRIVETDAEALFEPAFGGKLPAPAGLERIEIPGGDVYSAPIWNGTSLVIATKRGLHRSQDGVRWRSISEWRAKTMFDLPALLPLSGGVLGWTLGMPECRSWDTLTLAEVRPNDFGYGRIYTPDFNGVLGASDGRMLAFLASPPKDTGDGTGWTLRASVDQGATWTQRAAPVRKPSHFEHGPFGWTVLGIDLQGEQKVLALSGDLVDWRTLELPKVHLYDLNEACQVGGRLHVLGATASDQATPGSDQSPFSTTLDGTSWSTRMLPVGLNAQLVVDGTRLWVVEGPTILASLDGSRWHRMPEGVLPPNTVYLLHRDDTMLAVRRWLKDTVSFSGELWRGPAITDAQIRAAPLEDTPEYEAPTPQSRWVQAVAICDEALTHASDEFKRSNAVAKLGQAYFAAHPGSTKAQQAQEALTWVNRLLAYQYDEDALMGAASAGSKFGGEDPGCMRELLELFHPDLRNLMRDISSATLDGTQRQYKLTTTKKQTPEPQKSPAPFDMRRRREAAARGDVAAMYDLGQVYMAGFGVPVDGVAASFWHERAKQAGFIPPNESKEAFDKSIELGSYRTMIQRFVELEDPAHPSFNRWEALKLARRGAGLGFFALQVAAANMVSDAALGLRDAREPFRLMQAAADAGDAIAIGLLGTYYEEGWGVERDLRQAIELYRRGTALGDVMSMRLLGELLVEGKGVQLDMNAGMELLARAAAAGDRPAKAIHEAYSTKAFHACQRPFRWAPAIVQPPQFDWSVRMFEAETGDAAAQYDMLQKWRFAMGAPADEAEALRFEAMLARQGDLLQRSDEQWAEAGSIVALHRVTARKVLEVVSANDEYHDKALAAWLPATKVNFQSMHDAAMLALSGTPSAEHVAQGLAWLETAVNGGHNGSRLELAAILEEGRHVSPDAAKALELFRRASVLSRQAKLEVAFRLSPVPDEDVACVMNCFDAAYMQLGGLPGASDEEALAHMASEVQRLYAAARAGELEAMPSAAVLAARPPKILVDKGLLSVDAQSALEWAWVYKALSSESSDAVDVLKLVRKALPGITLEQPRASLLAMRTMARLDAQVCRDGYAKLVASSSPDKCKLVSATRDFLAGETIVSLPPDSGVFPRWSALVLSDSAQRRQKDGASNASAPLRGDALLEAIADVPPPGGTDAYARQICSVDKEGGANFLRSSLRRLEAVRRHYGIGCAPDSVEALAWLIVEADESTEPWPAIAWLHDQLSDPQVALARRRADQLRLWRTTK